MRQQTKSVSSLQRELIRERAWRMRHEPTRTEWLVWQALRGGKLGVSFRRQVVLQGYIVDFYASTAKLAVEVDGTWHERRTAADARRDRVLEAAGYRVLRVSADEVLSSLPVVVARIRAAVKTSEPTEDPT